MRLTDLLGPQHVVIQHVPDEGGTAVNKSFVLERVAALLALGSKKTAEEILNVLLGRERLHSTGIGEGVAIPHGFLPALGAQHAALLLLPEGVDFQSHDGKPVTIVVGVLGPKEASGEHLKTLAQIARLLKNRHFRDKLLHSEDAAEAYSLLKAEEGA